MKKLLASALLASLLVPVCHFGFAQEAAAPGKAGAAMKAAKTPAKATGRLPSGFGDLGLSKEQKTSIYSIQNSYDPRIEKLEAELAALKEGEKQEIAAVLTPAQKEEFAKYQCAVKERAKMKAAAAEKSEK